jgi:hypothetical protein
VGCICGRCGRKLVFSKITNVQVAMAKSKNIITHPQRHQSNCWRLVYDLPTEWKKLNDFFANDLKRPHVVKFWPQRIRHHYNDQHQGFLYPQSIARKVLPFKLSALYAEEVESPSVEGVTVPRRHSESTWKKTYQGSTADPTMKKLYERMLTHASSDETNERQIRNMIHWYWENKCSKK